MKKCAGFICLSLLLLFLSFINVQASSKLNVFVSILPQKYFVEQVGAEHVNVNVMVGPGDNPATYEPTPQQMARLAKADIYFSIGVPFESAWLAKIKQNNEQLVVVECCESISVPNNHNHTHNHAHNDSHYDPHVWTNPNKVIYITNLIKKSLIEIDHKNTNSYEESSKKFVNTLKELDRSIKTKVVNLKNRELIVSHPSWHYFAEAYGFTQISIEQEGKEIQANSMVNLVRLAKQNNIKAVFTQPQFSTRAAKVIAKEIGADILELDPLAFNYVENMNNVTDRIVRGLSNE